MAIKIRKCRVCGTLENLVKNKNLCKECHNAESLKRWHLLSFEKKKEKGRIGYLKIKEKNISLSQNDIDFCVRKWIMKWKNRWVESDFLASRKNLDIDQLIILAKQGLEKFPYMDFSIDKKSKQAYWASVDRIDSDLDYSNINNLQFVPFWLNSAKMDLSINELKEVMRQFLYE